MRFFAIVVMLLALAAGLVCVGSILRHDTLQAWLTGIVAVFLMLGAGMLWGEDRE